MSRNLAAAVATHVAQRDINYALFFELDLIGDFTRLWSGIGTISAISQSWLGVGEFGQLSGFGEPTDLTEQTIQATLNLIPEDAVKDFIALFKNNKQTGRGYKIYVGFFDDDLNLLGGTIKTMSVGFINGVSMFDGPDFAIITLELATEATLLTRTHFWNVNNTMQQKLFSGDKGLEYLNDLDEELLWGIASKQTIGTGSGTPFNPNPQKGINIQIK